MNYKYAPGFWTCTESLFSLKKSIMYVNIWIKRATRRRRSKMFYYKNPTREPPYYIRSGCLPECFFSFTVLFMGGTRVERGLTLTEGQPFNGLHDHSFINTHRGVTSIPHVLRLIFFM